MRSAEKLMIASSLAAALFSLGCKDSNTAYNTSAEVCGAPPTNVEQELTHQAEVEISDYVQGGSGAGNKRKLTQVLSQQGLMCDALAYRACMAAYASEASAEQMQEMIRAAWSACEKQAQLPQLPQPEAPATTTTPPPQAPEPQPATVPVTAGNEDWGPGKYMSQAVSLVTTAAQRVEQRSALGFDGDASCVLGAFLQKGGKITMSRPFEPGKEYAILGGGAEGTQDLDLAVQAPDGTIIASDTENDATPVLDFHVPTKDNYRIILALPAATYDGTFAAIAIMKEGGYRIPTANVTKSFGGTIDAAARASRLVPQKWPSLAGLVFHEEEDWSFFGTVLLGGESITFGGLELRGPMSVVLSASDGQTSNIDLRVEDATNGGTEVAKDDEADANPLVIVNPTKGNSYRVEVSNPAQSGPSLVTTLVLEAE